MTSSQWITAPLANKVDMKGVEGILKSEDRSIYDDCVKLEKMIDATHLTTLASIHVA